MNARLTGPLSFRGIDPLVVRSSLDNDVSLLAECARTIREDKLRRYAHPGQPRVLTCDILEAKGSLRVRQR